MEEEEPGKSFSDKCSVSEASSGESKGGNAQVASQTPRPRAKRRRWRFEGHCEVGEKRSLKTVRGVFLVQGNLTEQEDSRRPHPCAGARRIARHQQPLRIVCKVQSAQERKDGGRLELGATSASAPVKKLLT